LLTVSAAAVHVAPGIAAAVMGSIPRSLPSKRPFAGKHPACLARELRRAGGSTI